MFVVKKVILESKLELPQILNRINEVTSSSNDKSLKTKFQGEINKNGFRILPSYNYSQNDQIRPEIHGIIVDNIKLQKREIHLNFSIPFNMCVILILAATLNLAILLFPQLIDNSIKTYRWLHLVCILVFLVAFFIIYFVRVSEAIKILRKLWNIRDGDNRINFLL